MSATPGEIELTNEVRFMIRRVFVSAIIGAASVIYLVDLTRYLDLKWDLRQLESSRLDSFLGTFVVAAAISAGVWVIIWWARQPHGARVRWDDTALTEYDGNAIRTCIPWAGALQQKVNVIEKRKGERSSGGAIVQISDAAGRLITVNGSSLALPWMMTRKLSAKVDLTELWKRALLLPAGKPFGPDRDSLRRPSLRLWSFLTFASIIAIGVGLMLLPTEREAPMPIAAGCLVLLSTTLLVPVRELWRLRARSGAIEVPLDGRLDLSTLVHGDALIDTRRDTKAWVVKGADGKVTALETADARASRMNLVLAVWLEVGLNWRASRR